jgi:hypothetical protein
MRVESCIDTAVALAHICMKNLFKNEAGEITHSLWCVCYGVDELTSCRVRNVSLHHSFHTGSGTHPASHPWGTVFFSERLNGLGMKQTK